MCVCVYPVRFTCSSGLRPPSHRSWDYSSQARAQLPGMPQRSRAARRCMKSRSTFLEDFTCLSSPTQGIRGTTKGGAECVAPCFQESSAGLFRMMAMFAIQATGAAVLGSCSPHASRVSADYTLGAMAKASTGTDVCLAATVQAQGFPGAGFHLPSLTAFEAKAEFDQEKPAQPFQAHPRMQSPAWLFCARASALTCRTDCCTVQ